MVVYSDDNHLTATYARSIAPGMTGRLASLMGSIAAPSARVKLAAAAAQGDLIRPIPSHLIGASW